MFLPKKEFWKLKIKNSIFNSEFFKKYVDFLRVPQDYSRIVTLQKQFSTGVWEEMGMEPAFWAVYFHYLNRDKQTLRHNPTNVPGLS